MVQNIIQWRQMEREYDVINVDRQTHRHSEYSVKPRNGFSTMQSLQEILSSAIPNCTGLKEPLLADVPPRLNHIHLPFLAIFSLCTIKSLCFFFKFQFPLNSPFKCLSKLDSQMLKIYMKKVLDFLCEILHTEILIHTVLSFHMSLYERSGKRPSFNLLEVEEHDSHEILSLSHIFLLDAKFRFQGKLNKHGQTQNLVDVSHFCKVLYYTIIILSFQINVFSKTKKKSNCGVGTLYHLVA